MVPIPALLGAGGIFAGGGTFAWAATVPSAQLFGRTIRRTGDPGAIALTFDDGPNPAVTPGLLDLLDQYAAPATFFLIGKHVRAMPELAREVARRGHTIGNHTDTHPKLIFLSSDRIRHELDRCDEALEKAIGAKPRWMRPPYGFRGPHLSGLTRRRGNERLVMWSFSSRDWTVKNADPLIERLRRAGGGDIVLMHDGDNHNLRGDRQHTVKALAHWLPRWKDAGLRFVSLDQMEAAHSASR
jgi:peptidoglycan/xylan/chitin deacetylase (PgdA/CDA1 family)